MPGREIDVQSVLPVAPWTGAALLLVLLVALNVPAPGARPALVRSPGSPAAGLRAGLVLLLLGAGLVAVARTGSRSAVENPVPALVIGLGWPALVSLPALLALARRRRPAAEDQEAPRDVRPAVAAAAAVVGYLTLAPEPTDPHVLAVALGSYLLVLVAVGVALGGSAVGRTDVLGLLGRWTALGPQVVRWYPPRGAAAVLAVVLAGAWAERAQRTSTWYRFTPSTLDEVLLVAACGAVAGAGALALTRWSDGRAAPVLLPLAAGAVVGGVLRRAVISAQLLWDRYGAGSPGIETDPLGVAGGQAASLAVVTAAGALAAVVLARRTGPGAARLPGTAVVLLLTGVSAVLVLAR